MQYLRLEHWGLALVAACPDEIFSLCDVAFHVAFPAEVLCLVKDAFPDLDGISGDF